MKKAVKLLLLMLVVVTLCAALASCGEKPGPTDPVCVHTYDDGEITKAATCISKATRTYTCTKCGDSYTQEDGVLAAHTYSTEGIVTKEPTCVELGVMSYPCTVDGCTATDNKAITFIPHEPSEEMANDDVWHWYPCTMCGQKQSPAGHVFDDSKTTVKEAPTCLSEGTITKTCSVCNAQVDATVAKIDHTWNDGEVVKAPSTTTCESGRTLLTCTISGCGATKTVATPAAIRHTVAYESVTVSGSKQLKFACTECEESWTSTFAVNCDGTSVLPNDIKWNIKEGYASEPAPSAKDGAIEILLKNDQEANSQAEFFFPAKDKVTNFSAANSGKAIYTISLKAPTGGLFTSGLGIKMTNEGVQSGRWSKIHSVNLLDVQADGTVVGNVDAEGNKLVIGQVTAEAWLDIHVAIELDGMNIYFTYFANGEIRGTSVIPNTLQDMTATGTYATGNTNKGGSGILIDNMTWSHTSDAAAFLPYARHLEHTWVKGDTVAPSTDTCEPGYTEYVCSECGNVKHDDFVESTVEHTWSEFDVNYTKYPVAADPENGVAAEDGAWTLTCTECGSKKECTGSFEEHAHDFDASSEDFKVETETEITYKCTVPGCEHTKTEPKTQGEQ